LLLSNENINNLILNTLFIAIIGIRKSHSHTIISTQSRHLSIYILRINFEYNYYKKKIYTIFILIFIKEKITPFSMKIKSGRWLTTIVSLPRIRVWSWKYRGLERKFTRESIASLWSVNWLLHIIWYQWEHNQWSRTIIL